MSQARALEPLLPVGVSAATSTAVRALTNALSQGSVAVLSGAGLSTESGLRDYRSPGRERTRTPMNAAEFAGSRSARRRYWARAYAGFVGLTAAEPNRAHHALARLHQGPRFDAHITQNVDGLLQAAGGAPRALVELHGSIRSVECKSCGARTSRAGFQERLADANAGVDPLLAKTFRPDGDAEVPRAIIDSFKVPVCDSCGADELAPAVVFHGGSVPREVTAAARAAIDAADVVWVIGSTLTPFSAFSLVRRAKVNGTPVVALNFGPTRADDQGLLDLKVEADIGGTVERVARYFGY